MHPLLRHTTLLLGFLAPPAPPPQYTHTGPPPYPQPPPPTHTPRCMHPLTAVPNAMHTSNPLILLNPITRRPADIAVLYPPPPQTTRHPPPFHPLTAVPNPGHSSKQLILLARISCLRAECAQSTCIHAHLPVCPPPPPLCLPCCTIAPNVWGDQQGPDPVKY